MPRPAASRRHAQLIALCASLVVVVVTLPVRQGVYSDPAVQLKAVQQRLSHESPSINMVFHPASDDLSRDAGDWIAWWTPGTQLVVYPFMRAGLSLGRSVRVVAAAALILGSIGWATWFSVFALPDAVLFALAALFPCVRYASNGLFLYSAESLVFAAGPWMLIATMAFLDRNRTSARGYVLHFVLGLALGAAYWLKDSLGFVAFGATVALALSAWRDRAGGRLQGLSRCAATAAGAAIPFLALSVMNRVSGALGNKVTAALAPKLPDATSIIDALALPALQMADAFAMWDYLLMHPSHPVIRNAIWISVIGAPGGLLLWWLLWRPRVKGPQGLLARSVLVCSLCAVLGIWTVSAAVDHKPRHIASAAFAVLPLLIAEAHARWASLSGVMRPVLGAAAVCYLCVPLAYGAVSIAAKVRRFPSGYRPGPADIYNPLLSATDIASVRETLLAYASPDAVWYVSDPVSALDLPGRAIATAADFDTLESLRQARYIASRPLKIRALLLTVKFALDGKGRAIRDSFPQAGPWNSVTIPGSDYSLWTADLIAGH